jgi:hypothetical protein
VHIGHDGHPLVDEWQLRDVEQLCASGIFEWNTLGPRLDRNSGVRLDYVVSCVAHDSLFGTRLEKQVHLRFLRCDFTGYTSRFVATRNLEITICDLKNLEVEVM